MRPPGPGTCAAATHNSNSSTLPAALSPDSARHSRGPEGLSTNLGLPELHGQICWCCPWQDRHQVETSKAVQAATLTRFSQARAVAEQQDPGRQLTAVSGAISGSYRAATPNQGNMPREADLTGRLTSDLKLSTTLKSASSAEARRPPLSRLSRRVLPTALPAVMQGSSNQVLLKALTVAHQPQIPPFVPRAAVQPKPQTSGRAVRSMRRAPMCSSSPTPAPQSLTPACGRDTRNWAPQPPDVSTLFPTPRFMSCHPTTCLQVVISRWRGPADGFLLL